MDPRDKVASGYDRIAEHYLAAHRADSSVMLAALEELAALLPQRSSVLDLGCGAGVPALQWLAQRFRATGVDVSARQLELARQHAPSATLIRADMATLELAPAGFDAVVALFSMIHVPRTGQPALLERIAAWLKPGGYFLATWALDDWEGEDSDWEGWGAPMWWSHYGAETNLAMLAHAGFSVSSARRLTSNAETWLWILAQAPAATERG